MPRIVTQLPLIELWDNVGPVAATRTRDLTADSIRDLLRAGPVRFVTATIAAPLRWVPVSECFGFWKTEVQPRMAAPSGASLEDFHGGYCYFASEWMEEDSLPVVLLSVTH